jgi:hypothetical protein
LRASNGSTSSGETFWLIAAIRKKERSGPGIVAVAGYASGDAEEGDALDCGAGDSLPAA